jgi:hypothetical protein
VLKTGREKFTSLSQRKRLPKIRYSQIAANKNKPTNNGGRGDGPIFYFWISLNVGWCVSLSGKSNCDTDWGLLFFLHKCIEMTLNTCFFVSKLPGPFYG